MTYGYLIAKYLYTAYYLLSIANLQGDGEGKHEHRNSIRMGSEQEGTNLISDITSYTYLFHGTESFLRS
jgi:hypothetical protein